jgi:hypothetical protein
MTQAGAFSHKPATANTLLGAAKSGASESPGSTGLAQATSGVGSWSGTLGTAAVAADGRARKPWSSAWGFGKAAGAAAAVGDCASGDAGPGVYASAQGLDWASARLRAIAAGLLLADAPPEGRAEGGASVQVLTRKEQLGKDLPFTMPCLQQAAGA